MVLTSGEPEVPRLVGESTRRHPVSSGECARERFDRVVASLEASLGDADAAAESPCGALQQETATEGRRRLADPGAHQAAEVKRAEHRSRRDGPPVEALVERFEHRIDDVAQAIRRWFHAPKYARGDACAHDRDCCLMRWLRNARSTPVLTPASLASPSSSTGLRACRHASL
jgi:hypothetical protein